MRDLKRRVAALETAKPWHQLDCSTSADAELLAFLGWPVGYVPTEDELQAQANGTQGDRYAQES